MRISLAGKAQPSSVRETIRPWLVATLSAATLNAAWPATQVHAFTAIDNTNNLATTSSFYGGISQLCNMGPSCSPPQYYGASFATGSNQSGYHIDGISVLLASGSALGSPNLYDFALYSTTSGLPAQLVAYSSSFSLPQSASRTYTTYSSNTLGSISSYSLAANTVYVIAVRPKQPAAGTFMNGRWYTTTNAYIQTGSFTAGSDVYFNGSTWRAASGGRLLYQLNVSSDEPVNANSPLSVLGFWVARKAGARIRRRIKQTKRRTRA